MFFLGMKTKSALLWQKFTHNRWHLNQTFCLISLHTVQRGWNGGPYAGGRQVTVWSEPFLKSHYKYNFKFWFWLGFQFRFWFLFWFLLWFRCNLCAIVFTNLWIIHFEMGRMFNTILSNPHLPIMKIQPQNYSGPIIKG